ncbi:hypothetical protein [Streptomyces sp. NPDC001275]
MNQAGVEHDAVDGLVQGAVGSDDALNAASQQITHPVPVAQLRLADIAGDRLGGVPGEGFAIG